MFMNSEKPFRDLLSTLSHDIRGSLGGADALNHIIGDPQRCQLDERTQKRLALIHRLRFIRAQRLYHLLQIA